MAADFSDPPASPEMSPSHFDDDEDNLHPTRRVKPLPKRQRMIDPVMMSASETAGNGAAHISSSDLSEAADQLADALSTGMALKAQYGPLFNGAQDLLLKDDVGTGRGASEPFSFRLADNDAHDDGDHGDGGEYIDHLQQPENKKKRKVPGVSRLGEDGLGGEDDLDEASLFTQGRRDLLDSLTGLRIASPTASASSRGVKLTRASKAALQQKELLKSRKRQLATVLGALSHGDTLALDQALSTTYPLAKLTKGPNSEGPPVRFSRRHTRRKARALLLALKSLEGSPLLALLPSESTAFHFTFECDSATSERLRATKDEVAFLHGRFEAELSRQAAKATELAKEAAALASKAKQVERAQRRERSGASSVGLRITDTNDVDKTTGIPSSKSKKKKRSALANASNPHHLRNYVPSRLPNSSQVHSNMNAHNNLGIFPLRFLSADIPPMFGKLSNGARRTQISNPGEEWICSLCEYKLFYGEDEHERRRAIRNRKKILSRRRRAVERAAAAASGAKQRAAHAAPLDRQDDDASDGDELEDALGSGPPDRPSPSKQAKIVTQQERDRDK